MIKWDEDYILINNQKIKAICPVIISASRATDIPAFFSDWFFEKIKIGYIKWKNPFSGKIYNISFKNTRVIVFWSKNPEPIISKLKYLDEKKINYYFLYTLNDYEKENLEQNVPPLDKRINTFIKLSQIIGKEKVLWRYDPIMLGGELAINEIIERIKKIGDKIYRYTEKIIIGFIDIIKYKKVQNNLLKSGKNIFRELTKDEMEEFVEKIINVNKNWGLKIATCSESIELDKYGICHNKCIDDELMKRIFSDDKNLIDFLNQKNLKDPGQRKECRCIKSKDIGMYDSCKHKCVYCYATRY